MDGLGHSRAGQLGTIALLALAAWSAILLRPAPSVAAKVGIGVRDSIAVVAAPGEANRVIVVPVDGDAVLIRDRGARLRAGSGCTQEGRAVRCPLSQEVLVALEDRSDSFDASQLISAKIAVGGGPGNDRLRADGGSDLDDALYGGAGTDRLAGGGGGDYLFGGPGSDVLAGGPGSDFDYGGGGGDRLFGESGADTLSPGRGGDLALGGPGQDTLVEISVGSGKDELTGGRGRDRAIYFCPACRVSLDRRPNDGSSGGSDDVRAEDVATPGSYFDQNEETQVTFPPGDDVVRGDGGANTLKSGLGRDRISAGGGRDRIDAGAGSDQVEAEDGEIDRVECGSGDDRAAVDPVDVVSGCERIR